jgi:hypothetical protein
MIFPNIIQILNKYIKKLGLEDWVINVALVDPKNTCQIWNNQENYFFIKDTYAITYCLPKSKIAEIYLFDLNIDLEYWLLHELLHVKLSEKTIPLMYEIETSNFTTEEARQYQQVLRNEEHRKIDELIPLYLEKTDINTYPNQDRPSALK